MRLSVFLLLLLLPFTGFAQSIHGVVSTNLAGPLAEVSIVNIHSGEKLLSDAQGRFEIEAKPGQLIEFQKQGFKTARVRIGGMLVPFYRIILQPGPPAPANLNAGTGFQTFQEDSIYYHNLFKKQINFPTLTGLRAIQSPFSALGKTNQQMLRFQREFAWIEQQKFVDYAFNEKLVKQLTGLSGDSATQYMRRYRPSYEMLRSMAEYDFFRYVKETVEIWRRQQRMNRSRTRSAG